MKDLRLITGGFFLKGDYGKVFEHIEPKFN